MVEKVIISDDDQEAAPSIDWSSSNSDNEVAPGIDGHSSANAEPAQDELTDNNLLALELLYVSFWQYT